MTNKEFSESYVQSAQFIFKEAEQFFAQKVWHLVVRRAQECVELCLKGMLRQAGIEVPRLHDVGSIFLREKGRFTGLDINRIVSISRLLREERELSFYGDDLTETPPDQLYSEADARQALENARYVIGLVEK